MIAIIGGGAIGLAIGWRLASADLAVTVFDRGRAGSAASEAAAGMLAPVSEAEPEEDALIQLALAGHAMWPAFAVELTARTGTLIDYWQCGGLHVALDRDEVERLRFLQDFLARLQLEARWLGGTEARSLSPHLSPNVKAALVSPTDHQVDNRKLMAALRTAFVTDGGWLQEHTEVTALDLAGGKVTGVIAGGRRYAAELVILAAGAWSGANEALPAQYRPPVRPVKGQMLSVRMSSSLTELILWRNGRYLVPRRDGRLLIGATVEERGFDDRLTAGGLFQLLEEARALLPDIDELPIEERWSGFRPASRDDAPILGPSPLPGLIYATGHYRHGILLTPITAAGIAEYVLHGTVPPALQPFSAARFAARGSMERVA
ncbi:glycine oxidase ThiO [Dongia deserti]|uniref:glycine oxidase ThiO n=1 Tax=Dongia deserti TaxID=2268030 RepID=UPI000E647B3D|nr:glycine oxidase ThiO [Dongia deserti]